MKDGKNLPTDHAWNDTKILGAMGKTHEYVNGEYVETSYIPQEFPKVMYHADYVHDRKPGIEYGYNQLPQTVVNRDEEEALQLRGFKDSLMELGIVTSPDQVTLQKRKQEAAAAGANWRAHLGQPVSITEAHVKFLQSNGASEVQTIADAYFFLAKFTSTQMNQFLHDVKESESKGKGKKN